MLALSSTRVLLAALATVLVLGAGCSSDEDPADPATTTSAAAEPTATATAPTDDQFCALFLQFAGDQSQQAGAQTAETTEALIRSGLTLANLPPTDTMSPGVHASLVQLIAQTLAGVVQPEDLPVVDGTPDEAAFSAYLNEACPA